MSFLAPGLLWLLPLVALPGLIHLLSRRRPQLLDFPALEELSGVVEASARASRLRDRVLLALRTLAIAGAVLLAARPYWGREGGRGMVVAALDLSGSMGYREASGSGPWERARAATAALLRRATPDRPVALLGFDGSGIERLLRPGSDPGSSARALEGLAPRPYPGLAEPVEALQRAARQWGAEQRREVLELVIVSDFRGPAWGGPAVRQGAPEAPPGPRLVAVPVAAGDRPNRALVSLRATRVAPDRVRVDYGVAGGGAAALELDLDLDAEPLRRIELNPRSTTSGRIEIENRSGGLLRAAIAEDGLAADDLRYAVVPPWRPLRVWIVDHGAADASGAWVARILDPEEGGAVRRMRPEELEGEWAVEAPDLVVLADLRELPAATVDRLAGRLRREGGGLLAILGPRTDLRAWQSSGLAPLTGAEALDLLGAAAAPRVASADAAHPLLALFAPAELEALCQVPLRRAVALRSTARAVLTLAGGTPLLATRQLGRGRVAVLATALDLDWGDWPAHAGVVALIHQCALYLSGRGLGADEVALGAAPRSPLGPPGALDATLHLPSGDSLSVAAGGVLLPADLLRASGPYHWRVGAQRIDFVANVSPELGDLRWTDPATLDTGGLGAIEVQSVEELRERGLDPAGSSLAPWLVALVAALLLAEGWLRRPAAQQPINGHEQWHASS